MSRPMSPDRKFVVQRVRLLRQQGLSLPDALDRAARDLGYSSAYRMVRETASSSVATAKSPAEDARTH